MKTLKNILNQNRFHIGIQASIKEAMSIMYENKNGCVVILEENKPKAIITESDLVNALKENIDLDSYAYNISKKELITASENRPIDFAFDILNKNNIRRIILTNSLGEYVGVVLQEDLFEYLEEDVYKIDLKISDILKDGQKIISISTEDKTSKALKLMQEYGIGSIIVLDGEKIVGIITEKDILKLTYLEEDIEQSIVNHMTSPVITVDESELVTSVIDLMRLKSIRRIIILSKSNKIRGMLTNRDILRHIKSNYTRILQNKIKHAQEIMDFLPEPILEVYCSATEDVIYNMNYQAKKVFGKEYIDKNIDDIIPIDIWNDIKKLLFNVKFLKDIVIKIGELTYEISATVSKNISASYIKIIFKDVTNYEKEKTKLQELIDIEIQKRLDSEYLLMQQSKLATMGEMIGHIAHQWRQPLAQLGGIFMNVESAYEFDELTPEYLEKKINHGNELIKYMSKTIEDFRYFFEPNKTREIFSLNTYIQNAINIIEGSLTYNHIELDTSGIDKDIELIGFPSELSQVILNLLGNAKDVFVEKKIESPKISIFTKIEKGKTIIVVEDNGGGVDEKIKDKIFDMYFTTKPKKIGTGLGLYMSKLIIENKFNGKIYVSNTNGKAQFTIELSNN